MDIIKLTTNETIVMNTTSRGTQPKWFVNNKWYKQDVLGYEGLAECISSKILEKSNITSFVKYHPVVIEYNGKKRTGCYSENFLKPETRTIPVQKLYRAMGRGNLSADIAKIPETEDRIQYLVDFVHDATGLRAFGKYITKLLEFDAIILNEDRHLNNISVIKLENEDKYQACPVFDNGISLLSDMQMWDVKGNIYKQVEKIVAKPFSRNGIKQAEAAERLYGAQLEIKPCKKLIDKWLGELSEYYSDEILARAELLLREQFRKWGIE